MRGQRSKNRIHSAKVCILTSEHRVLDARIFHRQALSLARSGYEVHVFGRHSKYRVLRNVYIHPISAPKSRFLRKLFSSWKFFFRVLPEQADIYHFHDPALIFCGLALRILGKNVIMDVHEDFRSTIIHKKDYIPKCFRSFIGRIFDIVEKLSSKLFSGVIVVSENMMAKFQCSNIIVVRNFPPISRFSGQPLKSKKVFNVIYTGRIDRSRGCWQILEAFELLKQRLPSVKLTMIGSFAGKELESSFRKTAAKIGSVEIRAHLPWEQVRMEQLKADVGLVISFFRKDIPERVYPAKLFEYLSAGLPVVISRKAFWQLLLDECRFGIMVDGHNCREISDALYELALDKDLRMDMGLAGKKFVQKNFSWKQEFRKMNALYNRILGC